MRFENILKNKWGYLKEYSLIKNLFKNRTDFIIHGRHKTGKTELFKDLLKLYKYDNIILNFATINTKKDIFDKIKIKMSCIFKLNNKYTGINYLLSLVKILKTSNLKSDQQIITIIFENCQYLKNSSFLEFLYNKLRAFDNKYFRFNFVFLSRKFINIKIFKFLINYPNSSNINNFIEYTLNKWTSKFTSYKELVNEEDNKKIILFLSMQIEQLFNIIYKDFESYEFLTYLYFYYLFNRMNICKIYKYDIIINIINYTDHKIFINLLMTNPNNLYRSIKEILKEIDSIKLNNINWDNINLNLDITKVNIKNKLSIIPSILLISIFLASKINKKYDCKIFTNYIKKKLKKINITYKKNQKVKLSRLIAISEILMDILKFRSNNELMLEYNLSFHSNEFFVSLRLLESLKFIKINNLNNNSKLNIIFLGNHNFIQDCAKNIDIELSSFINIDNIFN